MSRFKPNKLRDFFKYYDPENPQHEAAVDLLQEEVESLDPDVMSDYAEWARLYRSQTSKSVGLKFTPFLFENLTGRPARVFSVEFCNDCDQLFQATGFSAHKEASWMLMSNLLHESGNFLFNQEIASGEAYEFRSDLANTEPGDGPKFKGCGPLMITGRGHFTAFYYWLKENKGIDDPRILNEGTSYVSHKYPFLIAINWIKRNQLLKICLEQGFDACCLRINGGWRGYQDRLNKYYICAKYMV